MILKKILLSSALLYCGVVLHAQTKTEIGKAVQNNYLITADTAVLRKALQATLADGTVIQHMHIESQNQFHYLVGEGMYKNFRKMIAVSLQYDITTRTYYATKGLSHVTCTSAACNTCNAFKENGKIIGCHCTEKSTISNQCNFTFKETSLFYSTFLRMMSQKNK